MPDFSPARPESAETASSPRDAPFRGQGRSKRRGEGVRFDTLGF